MTEARVRGVEGGGGSDPAADAMAQPAALLDVGVGSGAGARTAPSRGGDVAAAESLPVAEVLIDSPLPHLDRTFDYLVPAGLDAAAEVGVRVRVRFSGRDVDGYLLARKERSEHDGALTPLLRVTSAVPVLPTSLLRLVEETAERYAGTRSDVLRLAIPPRHARTEKSVLARAETPAPPVPPLSEVQRELWAPYPGGPAFLSRLAAGESPRAALSVLPDQREGRGWADTLVAAAQSAQLAGRSVLVVVPDYRDLEALGAALDAALGAGAHLRLSADEGPAARYGAYLQVLLGATRIVIGTRAAAFAPLADPGLVICWDDGNESLAEQRSPYPHARELLLMRAAETGAAVLLAGYARSVEAQRLVEIGWCAGLSADRRILRERAPRVYQPDPDRSPNDHRRLPEAAFRLMRSALGADRPRGAGKPAPGRPGSAVGPVLIQVPRAGYLPALACGTCRKSARCAVCHGPLRRESQDRPASCGWCGRLAEDFQCPHCEGRELRSVVIGAERTTEELGRAFPGVPIIHSGASHIVTSVPDKPAVVVATVGAEPDAVGGYAAAVLLDGEQLLSLPGLRAGEQALRRWFMAAALVRGAADGGSVLITADEPLTVGALIRWDPAGYAGRELAERAELGFPPASRLAILSGPEPALREFLAEAELPAAVQVLGPTPADEGGRGEVDPAPSGRHRAILRFGYADGPGVTRRLRQMSALRAARKDADIVHVHVDAGNAL